MVKFDLLRVAYEQWAGRVGRFGVEETNERREGLLELAHRHNMTLYRIIFPRKISRTACICPMESHTFRSTISSHYGNSSPVSKELRHGTFGGAEINSDHDLVMVTVKLKLNNSLWNHGTRLQP